jgi:hypothetical protein
MANSDPWDTIDVDRQTMRPVSIVNPDASPADKTVCHRHAQDLEAMYAHVKAHDGNIYHTYGKKRLHYCPDCLVEIRDSIDIPVAPQPETIAIYVAAKQFEPDSQEAADKRWWEPCENEEHHRQFLDVTP